MAKLDSSETSANEEDALPSNGNEGNCSAKQGSSMANGNFSSDKKNSQVLARIEARMEVMEKEMSNLNGKMEAIQKLLTQFIEIHKKEQL